MDNIRRLEELFARFPGIGPRQAKRFVYHIQNKTAAGVKELADLIVDVKRATAECAGCHRFFLDGAAAASRSGQLCKICSDESRDGSELMVVARDSDLETVEKSGAYRGRYFVLGGTVPILDKEPEKRIRLSALLAKIADEKPAEVILSLNATPDGENTAELLQRAVKGASSSSAAPKVTILGRGLSTGAELEYVDADTIKSALENRR